MASSAAIGTAGAAEIRRAAVEEEVKRLVARELHDRVAQTLTGMVIDLENFKSQQVSWQDVVHELELIQGSTRDVLASIRQLLHDLRGDNHLADGFVESARSLVMQFQTRSGISARLEIASRWPEQLTAPASLNIHRILEEALSNIRLHSGARNVRVLLETPSDDELVLVVTDDGRGLDTDPSRPVGMGTIGMRERALLLGGRVTVESESGRGTTIRANFPRRNAAAPEPTLPPTVLTTRRTTA